MKRLYHRAVNFIANAFKMRFIIMLLHLVAFKRIDIQPLQFLLQLSFVLIFLVCILKEVIV